MLEVTSDLSKSLIKRQANGELDLVVALHTEKDPVDGMLLYTEPLVWITGQDQERHLDPILPLVVAPPPCIYRDRILHTLNDLTRSCRIAYLSSSYNGIIAAVRAGMGVTVMTESTIPPGIRHLSERSPACPRLASCPCGCTVLPESQAMRSARLRPISPAAFRPPRSPGAPASPIARASARGRARSGDHGPRMPGQDQRFHRHQKGGGRNPQESR